MIAESADEEDPEEGEENLEDFKIEHATREQKEEEVRRLSKVNKVVGKHPFWFYKPWGEQVGFHKSGAHIRLLLGPNRSGKSTAGIIEDIAFCMGVRPDGSRDGLPKPPVDLLVIVRDKRKSVEKVVMKKLKQYCPKSWITNVKTGTDGFPEKITFSTGSNIYIGSHSQDVDMYEGHDWDGIHCDEPPPRAIWIAAARGLMDTNGRAWFTLTPLKCPWLYEEIYSKADGGKTENFHLTSKSPFIEQEAVLDFMDKMNEDEIASRIYGKFSHLQGQIFKKFNRGDHVIPEEKFDRLWTRYMVMDPHNKKASYMIWVVVNPKGQVIVYDEWPNDSFYDMRSPDMSIRDICAMIYTKDAGVRIQDRIIDPNYGHTKSHVTGRTLIEDYETAGISFYGYINNDIMIGHQRIQDALKYGETSEPGLLITANCLNMIKALENYAWDEKDAGDFYQSRERPGEAYKDMIDCLRYLFDYGPDYIPYSPPNRGVSRRGVSSVTGY